MMHFTIREKFPGLNEYIRDINRSAYIGDSAKVDRIDSNAEVRKIGENAIVSTSSYCEWKNLEKAQIYGDATVKDFFRKVVYQAGEWEFRKA